MKKLISILLITVLTIGFTCFVFADEEVKGLNFGFETMDVYYDDENNLVVDGFFYNAGSVEVGEITNLSIKVADDIGIIGETIFDNDDNLQNISLKTGEVDFYEFTITESEQRDLNIDDIIVESEFEYSYNEERAILSDGIKVYYNGKKVDFSKTKPAVVNGRTLIPVRGVLEAMGCEVEWNGTTKQVTITREESPNIVLTIGSKTAIIEGQSVELEVPAQIINGSTFIPLRFVSEALGSSVIWGQEDKVVIIAE